MKYTCFLSLPFFFFLFWFFWKCPASLELVLLTYKSNVWFKKHLSQVNGRDKVLRENDACGEVAGKANTAVILNQQEVHTPPWPVRLRFALPDELDFPETKQRWTIHHLQMILSHRRLSFNFCFFFRNEIHHIQGFFWRSMIPSKQEYTFHSGHNPQREPKVRCQWVCAMGSPFVLLNRLCFWICSVQGGAIFCEIHHHQSALFW